ncbi:hypothetical protein CI610_02929 [invertebrate metagenome]|uniref:Uncharacterized protein n=1 Tax=invertebrate metagenome TaxID=1711999 RepID=A0A2H9T4K9_9ZZZZ
MYILLQFLKESIIFKVWIMCLAAICFKQCIINNSTMFAMQQQVRLVYARVYNTRS